nr:thiamine diphosphokinase [Hasllibacter sp. MH4015]
MTGRTGAPELPLKFNAPLLLVGGGPLPGDTFAFARARCEKVVAVDGGAAAILDLGAIPEAVIGDMDSLPDAARAAIPDAHLVHIAEQDSTDFDKALRSVDAPMVLAVGVTGARLDHELAVFHSLIARPDRRVIVVGEEDVVLHLPRAIDLHLPPGTRVSLFPMDGVRVSITGLRWEFDALDLHPARKIGTSNEMAQDQAHLCADGPGVLLILPREALDPAMAALSAADLHSPRG